MLLVKAELGRAVHHELVQLLERTGVEQDVEALAGRQLAPLMLRLDALQAAAKARLVFHFEELLQPFFVCHVEDRSRGSPDAAGYVCTIGLRRRRLSRGHLDTMLLPAADTLHA